MERRTSYMAYSVLLVLLVLLGCTGTPGGTSGLVGGEVTVLATTTTRDALATIAANFEARYEGGQVVIQVDSTAAIEEQLAAGAQPDVVISDTSRVAHDLMQQERIAMGSDQTVARSDLVLITPFDNPAFIFALRDLTQPGVRLLLQSDDTVGGSATLEMLANASGQPGVAANFAEAVLANVARFEPNSSVIVSEIFRSEADAAIVPSPAVSLDQEGLSVLPLPDDINVITDYETVVLADAATNPLAQEFANYLLTTEAQQVFEQFGFLPVGRTGQHAPPQHTAQRN